jgi:hypothetical protein
LTEDSVSIIGADGVVAINSYSLTAKETISYHYQIIDVVANR